MGEMTLFLPLITGLVVSTLVRDHPQAVCLKVGSALQIASWVGLWLVGLSLFLSDDPNGVFGNLLWWSLGLPVLFGLIANWRREPEARVGLVLLSTPLVLALGLMAFPDLFQNIIFR